MEKEKFIAQNDEKNRKIDTHIEPMGVTHSEGSHASRIVWRVAILGAVLVVLIALSVGIIKLVPKALSSLASVNVSISSLFSPKEKVTVNSDKEKIASGDSFKITWKHSGGTAEGYFTLTTNCQNNYHLEYPVGNNRQTIDCNKAIQIASSTTFITLIGVNNSSAPVTAPISVNFVTADSNKIAVTGTLGVVINPASNSGTSSNNQTSYGQNATSSSQSSSTSTSNGSNGYQNNNNPSRSIVSGQGDLTVQITTVGTQDRNTGAFVETSNINTSDRVIMKFTVQNVGSGPSGTWNLRANLPAVSVADQTKYISNQRSIPAGMAVSGELYVDYVQTGQNRLVAIMVNTNGPELRTDNNNAEVTINATGNNYNGGYGGGIVSNGVDLSARVLDTGIINRSNGQYSATNYIRSADRAGVRFQVTNQGSIASGNWSFSANLPNNNIYNNNGCYYTNGYYACPNNSSNNSINQSNQQSLAPGETRIYIVGFEGLQYGNNNTVSINLDPYNQIPDTNRSNNYATANIYVNSY